jgi:hypothetical protein
MWTIRTVLNDTDVFTLGIREAIGSKTSIWICLDAMLTIDDVPTYVPCACAPVV